MLSASASPRAHTILNLCVLNAHAFNLAWNVSLPSLSSKTVNKLENPVKTTSPNKSVMSFQDQRNWGLLFIYFLLLKLQSYLGFRRQGTGVTICVYACMSHLASEIPQGGGTVLPRLPEYSPF